MHSSQFHHSQSCLPPGERQTHNTYVLDHVVVGSDGSAPAAARLPVVVVLRAVPGPRRDDPAVRRRFHDGAAAATATATANTATAAGAAADDDDAGRYTERASVPAGAGHAVAVRELPHGQLVVAAHGVLRPDTGHVPVAGAVPVRRDGVGARPAARVRARPAAAHLVRPARRRVLGGYERCPD